MSATITDAYEYAVSRGYAGSEEEFSGLMALALRYESTSQKDLGVVTAFGYAKNKGYTGTQDEFETLLANIGNLSLQITAAAEAAEQKITEVANTNIAEWLDEHPEATTTVQDSSLTWAKFKSSEIPVVTPQMFGAKGDGVTDDTNAFILALQQNKTVFVPQGVYVISQTLEISDSTPLVGESLVRSKLKFNGSNTDCIKCTNSRCIIKNIQFQGNFIVDNIGTDNTNVAINSQQYNYQKFEKIIIKGFDVGIRFVPNGYGSYIKDCEIQSCNYGIETSAEFNSSVIDTCIITFCDIGILFGQGRTQSVLNCDIEKCNIGIKKNSVGDCLIENCYFENCIDYCIQIQWGIKPADSVSIRNCSFFCGSNYRSPLIYYAGRDSLNIEVTNCLMASSETEGISDVYILSTNNNNIAVIFKNNVYSSNFIVSSSSIVQNQLFDSHEAYKYISTTDLRTVITDSIKNVRFVFNTDNQIILNTFSDFKNPYEAVRFIAHGSGESYMQIATSSSISNYGYSVIGQTNIYPNKIYTVFRNRVVTNSGGTTYEELIVVEG